jgi:D-serine deaminase-like pyridoxal phosphate-dependent protein
VDAPLDPPSLAWNRALIGAPGSLARIDTPVLLLDLDAFEANVRAMAGFARERGVALRPHAKTHKSVEIGRRQIEAGALGLCCAKLGEAEALADGGLDGLLITSTVIGPVKIGRLLDLAVRLREVMVVVDDAENAVALAEAAAGRGLTLAVLIVCDIGAHRFGVTGPAEAVELARVIAARPSLRLTGIQGYLGTAQHIEGYAERAAAARDGAARLAAVRDALRSAGHAIGIVTGSGTGTHDIDAGAGVFTELQVGSYVFCDADYDRVQLTADGARRFANALFVLTRVVSNRQNGFVTTDAGSKAFALDGPPPPVAWGAPEGSAYRMFGDQFGRIDLPAGANGLPLGTLVACVVPHCDPNVNLYDHYVCVRGDTVEGVWRVDGRGRLG